MAGRYARSGEPVDDLVQVACVGLLKAIDRFDPESGNEFASYAIPTMVGELRRYFRSCSWALHVPRAEQERVLAVRTASRELTGTLGRSPKPQEIADAAALTVEEVLSALETETATRTASLDAVTQEADTPVRRSSCIAVEDDRLDYAERRTDAFHGLRLLEQDDQRILYMRFFESLTQAEMAERLGVSQMQVSRSIRRALERSRVLAGEPSGPPET